MYILTIMETLTSVSMTSSSSKEMPLLTHAHALLVYLLLLKIIPSIRVILPRDNQSFYSALGNISSLFLQR